MGTRADFFVGRGKGAEWIGSIAWDGYWEGIPEAILGAKTLDEFRAAVGAMLDSRDDGTHPSDGWPWPWEDPATTDCTYAFDGDKVYAGNGHDWFAECPEFTEDGDPTNATGEPYKMPIMDKSKATLGPQSGLIVLAARR